MDEQASRLEYLQKMRTRAALSTVHHETISAMKERGATTGRAGEKFSCGEQAAIALENIANAQDARRLHQAPPTRVDLVPIEAMPQPDSTLVNVGPVDPTSSFLTFWGVWFIVAAVSRFKRPLRRKRAIDAARAKALQEEVARRKGQELQHLAALDHDLGRMATTFLQKTLLESEALKKRSRESSSRRTGAIAAAVPPVAPADMSQFRRQPLDMKRLLEPQFDPKKRSVTLPAKAPATPLSSSRPCTRGTTFETKAQVRAVEGTLAKVLEGKCVAGGLVRRVSPTQLAHFMFDTLVAPKSARAPCPPRTQQPVGSEEPLVEEQNDPPGSSQRSSPTVSQQAPPPTAPTRAPAPPPILKKPELALSPEDLTAPIEPNSTTVSCTSTAFPQSRAAHATSHHSLWGEPSSTLEDSLPSTVLRDRANHGRRKSTVFQPKATASLLLHEADFFDDPAVQPPATSQVDNPMGSTNKRPGTVGYALSKRFDKNAFFEQTLRKLKEADTLRRSALDLKRQYLAYHLHKTQDDGMLSCRDLLTGLKAYVHANQRQLVVNGEHEHRAEWFYRFFEGMTARCNFSELEGLLQLMEKQLFDPDCRLGQQAYSQLVAAASPTMLLSPSVQFFLCRAAVAYGVPYLSFREVLELNHAPYLLQGDGSSFKLAPTVHASPH